MSRKSSAPAWYISVVLLILIHRLSKRSFKNYSRCEVNMFFSQQFDSSIYYRIRDILLSLNRKSDNLLSLYRCVRCQHDWMSLLTQIRIIFELVSHWTVLSGFSFGWISRWFLSFHYYWTDNGQMLGYVYLCDLAVGIQHKIMMFVYVLQCWKPLLLGHYALTTTKFGNRSTIPQLCQRNAVKTIHSVSFRLTSSSSTRISRPFC